MSKYLEYLKLIPKGIANADKVIEGWVNSIKLHYENLMEEEMQEIITRRGICETCPFNSKNAQTSKEYFDLYKQNYKTDRDDFHCSICSCPIEKKTASLSSDCGMESWNISNPENPQELKWKSKK